MKALHNILAKLGIAETERNLIIRTIIISTILCAMLIGAFWVLHVFGGGEQAEAPLLDDAVAVSLPEVGELDLDAHILAARRFIQSGRHDAAIPHLLRVVATGRGTPAALSAQDLLITSYIETGEFNRAVNAIDNLIAAYEEYDLTPLETSLRIRRGIALYHMREFDAATEILQSVLAAEPDNIDALVFMGQMEAAEYRRSPTAERFFRRALELDSNHIEALYQWSRYHENLSEYATARDIMLRVVELQPLHIRAHARLGMIYFYMLESDLALKSYQTALALNPYDYNTRYNLGELYRTLLNDNESALREFVRALELDPTHREANYRAGLICAANGMLNEAIRYFEAALRGDRRNVVRLLQLAAAYERQGNKDAALAVYREVVDVDPLHSIAINKIRFLSSEQ